MNISCRLLITEISFPQLVTKNDNYLSLDFVVFLPIFYYVLSLRGEMVVPLQRDIKTIEEWAIPLA